MNVDIETNCIGVVGLGYVGLPLAASLGRRFVTIGFDIDEATLKSVVDLVDPRGEVSSELLAAAEMFDVAFSFSRVAECDTIIITVPTPVTPALVPDLNPLRMACESVGRYLKKGTTIVIESTVYPGVTMGLCRNTLAKSSNLEPGVDFFMGYSPERVNPGDCERTVDKIVKVVAGENDQVTRKLDSIYSSVISAGTHLARTIEIAEAAKVIENAQRDINIAFINELAKIFRNAGIPIREVLAAARTKWNFISFEPGFVGGHCIGVDPYYLAEFAHAVNVAPEIILSGRKTNDSMPGFMATQVANEIARRNNTLTSKSVLVLGMTFKENCADIRNSKVPIFVDKLIQMGLSVTTFDPYSGRVSFVDFLRSQAESQEQFDAIFIAVKHSEFSDITQEQINSLLTASGFVFDFKGVLPESFGALTL